MTRTAPLLLVLALPAWAADVDGFDLASSVVVGTGTLQGESPVLPGDGAAAGLLVGYTHDPVVRYFEDGTRDTAVSAMVPLTAYGGWTLAERARFDVFVPIYAFVDAPVTGFSGVAAGDLRLQAVVPFYRLDERLALAAVPRLGLPTGTGDALTRQGFQASAVLSAGGEIPEARIGWVSNLGLTGSGADDVEGIGMGSTFDLLAGGWWHATGSFRMGAEVDLSAGLVKGSAHGNTASTGHLFAQHVLPSGLGLTAGAGTGLIAGLGAPAWRMVLGVHYAERISDADRDGLVDADDRCPNDPEDLDGRTDDDGCPDPDDDLDGVVDLDDECPDGVEDHDGFQDGDGCPDPDNDGDGTADADDRCPDLAGGPTTGGCPDTDSDGIGDADDACPDQVGSTTASGCPDRDSDGVADARDACPEDPRHPAEAVERSDGCPKTAFITERGIVIGERIEFATGSSRLRRDTTWVVDAVAAILKDHSEIARVEVQGHTDNTGSADANLALSQARAEAVVNYLVAAGISKSRLSAKGYGHLQPLDTNRTETGRETNRRVEFAILETTAALSVPSGTATPAVPLNQDPAGAPGQLTVVVEGGYWADVFVDGKRLAKTAPFTDVPIAVGSHEVWVRNELNEVDHRQQVEVHNGELLRVVAPGPPTRPPPEMPDPWAPVTKPDRAPETPPTSGQDDPLDDEDLDAPIDGKRPPRSSKKR